MIAKQLLVSAGVIILGCVGCSKSGSESRSSAGTSGEKPETVFISIGTGGVTGVYYQFGGAIAKLVNAGEARHGIKVSFQATGGSVYNINALMSGAIDIGIAQSDRQYQAVNGENEWKGTPQTKLRAVCSIHPEAVTLVAADDTGIRTLEDCRGRRVNIGNAGSGQRSNAMDVLKAAGINPDTDLHTESLKAADAPKILQDGGIDAFFYTVGHPAGAITEATAGRRRVRFVPLTGMEKLLEEAPYYADTMIPVSLYPQAANSEDVPTIGVMTTLVTSADVPEAVVYELCKALFEGLDEVRSMHPAFAHLTPEHMVKSGNSAPFHAGAIKYYREVGLMP